MTAQSSHSMRNARADRQCAKNVTRYNDNAICLGYKYKASTALSTALSITGRTIISFTPGDTRQRCHNRRIVFM